MSHTIRHICTAHGRRAGKSVVVALMTLACSVAAWAVEFGAVTVNSQQGQPLNADVVLVDLPMRVNGPASPLLRVPSLMA